MQRAADGARGRARTRNPVQEYKCPACGARYNTLQALSLIDPSDGLFHCEACRAVLVDEEPGGGGGGEGARGARLAEAKALQVCGVEQTLQNRRLQRCRCAAVMKTLWAMRDPRL